jgi:hypothetical protein
VNRFTYFPNAWADFEALELVQEALDHHFQMHPFAFNNNNSLRSVENDVFLKKLKDLFRDQNEQ